MLGGINIDRRTAENLCRLFGCLKEYDVLMHNNSNENLLSERIRYKINTGRNSLVLKIERFFRIEKTKLSVRGGENQAVIIKDKKTLSAIKYI